MGASHAPIGTELAAPSRRGRTRQKVKAKRGDLPGAEIAAEMHGRRAEAIDARGAQRKARLEARAERKARRAA